MSSKSAPCETAITLKKQKNINGESVTTKKEPIYHVDNSKKYILIVTKDLSTNSVTLLISEATYDKYKRFFDKLEQNAYSFEASTRQLCDADLDQIYECAGNDLMGAVLKAHCGKMVSRNWQRPSIRMLWNTIVSVHVGKKERRDDFFVLEEMKTSLTVTISNVKHYL